MRVVVAVVQSLSVFHSLKHHGLSHARPPCTSPSPRACSNSCPLSLWCQPTLSSSVSPSFSCLQSCPASGSLPLSLLFASSGQSIGASASASVFPINIQCWFPLWFTSLISLLSKGLSSVFSNTAVQKHQFLGSQPFLWSISHFCPVYLLWNDGTKCHDLCFIMLSFRPRELINIKHSMFWI